MAKRVRVLVGGAEGAYSSGYSSGYQTGGGGGAYSSGYSSGYLTNPPSGLRTRVEYAVGDVEPVNEGAWVIMGYTDGNGYVIGPPAPSGERVWIRARIEPRWGRPGPWAVAQWIDVGNHAQLGELTVQITTSGAPVVLWTANVPTKGVRIEYQVHVAYSEPGIFASSLDVENAGRSSLTAYSLGYDSLAYGSDLILGRETVLPVTVNDGEQITVRVTPYNDWDGSNVAGTPGASSQVYAVASATPVGSGYSSGYSSGYGS
jgi:hypothetical protein